MTRKRALVGIASAAVIVGGVGWMSYLLRPRKPANVKLPSPAVLEESREMTEARINRARQLRETWRPWALKHKAVLQSMLKPAQGKEKEALDNAYAGLPGYLTEDGGTGLHFKDLNANGMDFTWQPASKMHGTPTSISPRVQEAVSKENKFMAERLRSQYDKYHDIEISRSMNAGITHTTLWASGRITTTTAEVIHDPRGTTVREGIPREIVPPYDEVVH